MGEQEEQGRADQPLDHAEAAAEHPVDRAEDRPPRLAADRAGEQFDRDIGRQEQQGEGHRRGAGLAPDRPDQLLRRAAHGTT